MTPKEKAKELHRNMYNSMENLHHFHIGHEAAKQCALICVEEMISLRKGYLMCSNETQNEEYWQQVKTEIENL